MSQFQNWSQQKTKLLMGTFAGTAMKIRCMLTVQVMARKIAGSCFVWIFLLHLHIRRK